MLRVVKAENVTKRSIARVISFDDESLATVLMIGLLVQKAPGADDEESMIGIPQRLLTSLFGAGPLRDVAKWARADLLDRIGLIFDEETAVAFDGGEGGGDATERFVRDRASPAAAQDLGRDGPRVQPNGLRRRPAV